MGVCGPLDVAEADGAVSDRPRWAQVDGDCQILGRDLRRALCGDIFIFGFPLGLS
jgi:hypothetical protein